MTRHRFADRVLLSRVLKRTIPPNESLEDYQALSDFILGGSEPGHERMIPPNATYHLYESAIVPGGPFTVAVFPRTRLLNSIGPDDEAGTIVSPKLYIPLIAVTPHLWEARGSASATFDHEAVHVLQGLRHGSEGRVNLPTVEEAFAVIIHRIKMEFDAYFVELLHHPLVFAKEINSFDPIPNWTIQQLALFKGYVAGIEDAASCAFFMREEMYWPFMEVFTANAPHEFLNWGLSPETVEWWKDLSHRRNAGIAWDRTADLRASVGLHRAFKPFFRSVLSERSQTGE